MLPNDIIFPIISDFRNVKDVENYVRNLTDTITQMYSDIVNNVNGSISTWSPTIYTSTAAGAGTYTIRDGFYRRYGIMTQLWGEVEWTAHTGSGNIYIEAPYESAESTSFPFVGIASTNILSYTPGFTYPFVQITPGTFRLYLMQCGSAKTSTNIALQSSGNIKFYIEYIGKDIQIGE